MAGECDFLGALIPTTTEREEDHRKRPSKHEGAASSTCTVGFCTSVFAMILRSAAERFLENYFDGFQVSRMQLSWIMRIKTLTSPMERMHGSVWLWWLVLTAGAKNKTPIKPSLRLQMLTVMCHSRKASTVAES